jgi:O-antigen ligase
MKHSMRYPSHNVLRSNSLVQPSRAGEIASLGVDLPIRKKWVAVGLVGVLVLLSFVFLPPDQLIGRFAELGSSEGITANDRVLMWKETLHLIAAYPLFGCGLGGYESAFNKFNVTSPNSTVDYAHNDYLQSLAELGGVGFSILALLVIAILAKAGRALSRHPRSDGRCLALACTSAMVAILIHSLVDFNLHIEANALLLAWISGMAVGVQETVEPRRREGREEEFSRVTPELSSLVARRR